MRDFPCFMQQTVRLFLFVQFADYIFAESELLVNEPAQIFAVLVIENHASFLVGFHNIFVFHGFFESVFIEFNYIFGGAFRGDNSAGRSVPFIVVAEFAECRNVRQLGVALFIKYTEDTEFGIFTVNQFDDVGNFSAGEVPSPWRRARSWSAVPP